jgi:predicted RNase H-like HicB family nuclease
MTTYFGILEGRGKSWGVWFPDIPGCVAAGYSAEEALENAASALRLFADLDRDEGTLPPPARSPDQLSLDPDVQEALAQGDRLVGFDGEQAPAKTSVGA